MAPKISLSSRRIHDVALAVLRRHGTAGLSMRRVAASAGLTATAIYHHFAGKDALLESLADEAELELQRRFAAIAEGPPTDRALGMLRAYRDFAFDEPQLYELMFEMRRRGTLRFPDDFAAGRSASFDLLRSQVRAAQKEGRFRRDDELETTLALWAAVHGLIALFRAGRFGAGRASFAALFDRTLRRLYRGVATR